MGSDKRWMLIIGLVVLIVIFVITAKMRNGGEKTEDLKVSDSVTALSGSGNSKEMTIECGIEQFYGCTLSTNSRAREVPKVCGCIPICEAGYKVSAFDVGEKLENGQRKGIFECVK